jgi:hypothetical protein
MLAKRSHSLKAHSGRISRWLVVRGEAAAGDPFIFLLAPQYSFEVKGQYQAKRAQEVAVAGGHDITMLYAV